MTGISLRRKDNIFHAAIIVPHPGIRDNNSCVTFAMPVFDYFVVDL
jgi:hypothetical protein